MPRTATSSAGIGASRPARGPQRGVGGTARDREGGNGGHVLRQPGPLRRDGTAAPGRGGVRAAGRGAISSSGGAGPRRLHDIGRRALLGPAGFAASVPGLKWRVAGMRPLPRRVFFNK